MLNDFLKSFIQAQHWLMKHFDCLIRDLSIEIYVYSSINYYTWKILLQIFICNSVIANIIFIGIIENASHEYVFNDIKIQFSKSQYEFWDWVNKRIIDSNFYTRYFQVTSSFQVLQRSPFEGMSRYHFYLWYIYQTYKLL